MSCGFAVLALLNLITKKKGKLAGPHNLLERKQQASTLENFDFYLKN